MTFVPLTPRSTQLSYMNITERFSIACELRMSVHLHSLTVDLYSLSIYMKRFCIKAVAWQLIPFSANRPNMSSNVAM